MTHAGGRPTAYSEEMITKTKEYIATTSNLPTIQELATILRVNQDTLFEWAKHYKEFSESLSELKSVQATELINKGLRNQYNSTIAKLILSANHGMREKSDITTNDKDLPTPILPGIKTNSD